MGIKARLSLSQNLLSGLEGKPAEPSSHLPVPMALQLRLPSRKRNQFLHFLVILIACIDSFYFAADHPLYRAPGMAKMKPGGCSAEKCEILWLRDAVLSESGFPVTGEPEIGQSLADSEKRAFPVRCSQAECLKEGEIIPPACPVPYEEDARKGSRHAARPAGSS